MVMSARDSARAARSCHWLCALALVVVIAGSVWVRWPGFTQGGFANHDVAGILYGAMLLHAGKLPYVDSIELKAPGTFYLAALLAGDDGRDIATFQVWANLFALVTLLAVAVWAWRRWGCSAGVVAGTLYALHDAYLDSSDANYVTWAQLPQVLAIMSAMAADRASSRSAAVLGWTGAGALGGIAVLLKRPSATILILVLGAAALRQQGSLKRVGRVVAVAAGALAVHVPITLHYIQAGQGRALFAGYLFNPWAIEYLGREIAGVWPWEGAGATAFFLAMPLTLATYTLARCFREGMSSTTAWLVAWTAAALLQAWAGFRFYKGYFLAVAPPLCLLAANPVGLLSRHVRARFELVLAVPLLVLLVRQVELVQDMRNDRARAHDRGARRIAARLQPALGPQEQIWVWGWHLWDLYPLTGALSGSRMYKSLGLLTLANDDTWRRPQSPLQFRDGPFATALLDDLRRNRPLFVVLGSTVPRGQFHELRRFLDAHYRLDRTIRVGRVQVWRRLAAEPPRHRALSPQ